jgi:hypothetical protein
MHSFNNYVLPIAIYPKAKRVTSVTRLPSYVLSTKKRHVSNAYFFHKGKRTEINYFFLSVEFLVMNGFDFQN